MAQREKISPLAANRPAPRAAAENLSRPQGTKKGRRPLGRRPGGAGLAQIDAAVRRARSDRLGLLGLGLRLGSPPRARRSRGGGSRKLTWVATT